MAASFLLPQSQFLGESIFKVSTRSCRRPPLVKKVPTAKFNVFEILGGRGLCSGEENLQKELMKSPLQVSSIPSKSEQEEEIESGFPDEGFEKELLGLTGGFPGGEKGLQIFISQNPPPKKVESVTISGLMSKPTPPPQLPLLLPGMIAIVKNPNNPFYMYCGIVQRITDGKAGVLFEGGNWDRLVTFRLQELERREKGPPMVNPKSAILEQVQ